jgi:emp24/gp25L/p24 family/GOLD
MWSSLFALTVSGRHTPYDEDDLYHGLHHDEDDKDYYSRDWMENMLNFKLTKSEYFYEDIKEVSQIRGAFYVPRQANPIDFVIMDPDNKPVYEKKQQTDVYFNVKAEKLGIYTFNFSGNTNQVSFIVGSGKKSNNAQETDMKSIDTQINNIEIQLKDIQKEGKFLWEKQKYHLKSVKSINSSIWWLSAIELLVLGGFAVFQVFYLKKMLSYRRLY